MDLFKSINWTISPMQGPFLSDEYLMEHSMTYKLLTNQLQGPVIHEGDGYKGKKFSKNFEGQSATPGDDGGVTVNCVEPKTDVVDVRQTHFKYVAGLRKNLPFPKYSSLFTDEQKLYLKLRARFALRNITLGTKLAPEAQKEFQVYQSLHERVLVEQQEFNEFLRDHWTSYVSKYYTLTPDVCRYTTETWQHRLTRVDAYKPYYSKVKTVPLALQGNQGSVVLTPGQVLLQLGRVPFVIRPKFSQRVQIRQDYDKVIGRCPTNTSLPPAASRDCLHKQPVSEDQNARLLAEAHNVDVVISSSGLQQLAANLPPYDRSWDLPVVVRDYVDGDGKRRQVTYVDKPLPPLNMTVADRNRAYHKMGAKLLLCHPRHLRAHIFPSSHSTLSKSCEDTLPVSSATACSTKEKAADVVEASISQVAHAQSDTDWNDTDDEPLLVICSASDTEDSERAGGERVDVKERRSRETRSMTKSKSLAQGEQAEETKQLPLRSQPEPEASPDKQGASTPKPSCGVSVALVSGAATNTFTMPSEHAGFNNVSYQLWTIKRETSDQHAKRLKQTDVADREIKILVRTKLDGCERLQQTVVPVCVSYKLEYQSKFGAEVLDKDELIRDWLALTFKPRTVLLRVRVHAETSEVLLLERLTLEQLTHQCHQVLGFSTLPQAMASLYCTLGGLTNQPSGQYLLSHSLAMEAFALLQRGDSEWANISLKRRYETVDPTALPVPGAMPWHPVDMDVMMPYHRFFDRIPGTFNPLHGNKSSDQLQFKGKQPPQKRNLPQRSQQVQAAKNKQKKLRKKTFRDLSGANLTTNA